MAEVTTRSTGDLSPSAADSLAGIFEHRRATWREVLDGSAALLGGGIAGVGLATALLAYFRRRRRVS